MRRLTAAQQRRLSNLARELTNRRKERYERLSEILERRQALAFHLRRERAPLADLKKKLAESRKVSWREK
ncbi:MAG TPA: hypothetical protein VNL14_20710 [Candidatus Acidoferrales bacterium]|nr:hypothetical protein [Candidatus Acidoferrales bacterium]